jgi:HPt (histidine-containing phosphotransfer) domain-containing protein
MYYGYNKNNELILADEAFINLLGYKTFEELLAHNISDHITVENNKLTIKQEEKKIEANFTKIPLYAKDGPVELIKLSNVIEAANTVHHLQINYEPIYLNVEKISKEIGLSIDDYKLYLDSFIDQSIIDEKRLQEGDDKAIKNLSNLALTLKIPNINILLLKIKKLSKAERLPYIDEYYTKLALLTLKRPANYNELEDLLEEDSKKLEEKEEELKSTFTELLQTVESSKNKNSSNYNTIEEPKLEEIGDGSIGELEILDLEKKSSTTQPTSNIEDNKFSFEGIEALPINYDPKIAAEELNLPVVLIEEFVDDFIEQARHDKDHLLASYYQKDMDNIHELGHKLKGAASNLRINELADVLEEIQFCTEYEKLEALFTKYWGLFISLEDYMKQSNRP